MIQITIQINSKCGHDTFYKDCLWCKDAHKLARLFINATGRHQTPSFLVSFLDTQHQEVVASAIKRGRSFQAELTEWIEHAPEPPTHPANKPLVVLTEFAKWLDQRYEDMQAYCDMRDDVVNRGL